MTSIRSWFAGRTKREQRLLLVMAGLAIVTFIWALVIRPIADVTASERERHAAAVIRLGETQAGIEALRQRRLLRPLSGDLAGTVRALADEAGFAIASLDPDGAGGVRVGIPSARGAAMTAWLARIERAGLVVDSATLTDNGDRTVAARLVLRGRPA
jgi:general secretion pathway protein M